MSNVSYPMPTIDSPTIKSPIEDKIKEATKISEMNKDKNAMTGTMQSIGSVAESALKNVTGLLANIALYGSVEKVDYDADGNPIVDGIGLYKKRYRSTANLSENDDIAAAISEQKKELDEAKNLETKGLEFMNEKDLSKIIEETQDALNNRIFGPLWKNWTTGEDFLEAIKFTLQSLLDTFDPLMEMVDAIQEFVNNATSGIQDSGINIKTATGNTASLPLGVMAIQALNILVNYIRELIQNIEMLAKEYTTEELNVLVRKGTNGANWGSVVKSLQDLLQLIINCMKPYIHNLVMALILDAIDLIVDKLDKAGILSPSGPLKLIPMAITLVRAILRGDLEAIEEMVKKTITKMINIVQLAFIAIKDPSILWADTDRMDKEIAIARYQELAEDEDGFTAADKDKFLYYTDTNFSAGARHFLQKMKGENKEIFNQIANFASSYTDLSTLYKNAIATKNAKSKNENVSLSEAQGVAADLTAMNNGISKNLKEPNDG